MENLIPNELLRSAIMDGHNSQQIFKFKYNKNYFGNQSDSAITKLFIFKNKIK